ncbi:uncharacterized protein LOC125200513 [Salvia hispanica]|uniref:uncharacterized protein LOC125200513 n=1 Tax=Salvia hispanica TaxID=49212 RepID=UPI0020090666|nr:uncharacterized protein LOC125200513 [Salvia hispanica]
MAAFGAATSLKMTIESMLQSSRISLVPPSPQVLLSAYEAMVSLQKVLLKLDETSCSKIRTKVNALDERIKEAVWEFEDLLESHFYDQILPQIESSSVSERDNLPFSLDLRSLQQNLDCLVERVMVMKAEYDVELLNMPEEVGEPISSRIDFSGINSNMVGLSTEFKQVCDYLLEEITADVRFVDDRDWLLVTGMAGVGKTALAKKAFEDPSIQRHFDFRAWVKVGRKCEINEILRCILAQVDPNIHDQMLTPGDDNDDEVELDKLLEERLKDKKCLIVLDDVWEWDAGLYHYFPHENVRILVTSRLGIEESSHHVIVGLLTFEESKKLLGEKVFGEEGFPPQLDELGEEIAYKCEGLPLMVVTVAKLLSKEDKTPKYWTEVVVKKHNSVFVDAYNQISEAMSSTLVHFFLWSNLGEGGHNILGLIKILLGVGGSSRGRLINFNIVHLKSVLVKLDETGCSKIRTKVNALDELIKQVVWELKIYSNLISTIRFFHKSSSRDHLPFSVDVQLMQRSVDCLSHKLSALEIAYIYELKNMREEEGEPLSSRIDFCGSALAWLDYLRCWKALLLRKYLTIHLSRHISSFVHGRVGRKCESNEELRCILAQLDPNTRDHMLTHGEDEQKLVGILEESLKDKKCLIVLDDVWKQDTQLMDNLSRENVKILLTGRQVTTKSIVKCVRLLNEEEGKKLLGEKLFGEEGFPSPTLRNWEKRLPKIEGLPLMIVTVRAPIQKRHDPKIRMR